LNLIQNSQIVRYQKAETAVLSQLFLWVQLFVSSWAAYPLEKSITKERAEPLLRPLRRIDFMQFCLLEVTLQHTLEGLAVASLVAGHLVDGLLFAGLAGRS